MARNYLLETEAELCERVSNDIHSELEENLKRTVVQNIFS